MKVESHISQDKVGEAALTNNPQIMVVKSSCVDQ